MLTSEPLKSVLILKKIRNIYKFIFVSRIAFSRTRCETDKKLCRPLLQIHLSLSSHQQLSKWAERSYLGEVPTDSAMFPFRSIYAVVVFSCFTLTPTPTVIDRLHRFQTWVQTQIWSKYFRSSCCNRCECIPSYLPAAAAAASIVDRQITKIFENGTMNSKEIVKFHELFRFQRSSKSRRHIFDRRRIGTTSSPSFQQFQSWSGETALKINWEFPRRPRTAIYCVRWFIIAVYDDAVINEQPKR